MIVQGLLLHQVLDSPKPILGWLRIEGDRIIDVREGELPTGVRADFGNSDCIISPGFIDAHTHLPQFNAIGCDGMELLAWLDQVIYPAEAAWADEAFAHHQAAIAYRRLLRAGTLGYAGYLTSHFHAWAAAVRAAHAIPLRGIVGQSLMDRNAPAALLGQTTARLAASERGRLSASANPRFAISCSEEMMKNAAQRADARSAMIQTHLAETPPECERVRELFPDDPHYTGVYDRCGLLTTHTLLAHCVHLSSSEWELIHERQSVAVHCPGANTFLRSGLFDLDAVREHGVRLALGSDVAAGPDIAMPRVARAMIEVAKLRALAINPRAHVPTPAEAWHLITEGNAEACGWADAGRLERGAAADLLVLSGPFERDEHLIGRLIYGWDESWIAARIVAGVRLETTSTRD